MREGKLLGKIDWITVVIYITLMLLGWISIYAAVYNPEYGSIISMSQRYGKQLLWIFASIGVASVIMMIDSKVFSSFSYLAYGLTIFLLISVLIFGDVSNGAKSWFKMGSIAFQPSEIAKVATGLAMARYISSYGFVMNSKKGLGGLALILGTPILMIMLQPDLGSVLVYASFIFVLYREGLPSYILWFIFISGVIAIISLVLTPVVVFWLISIFTAILTTVLTEKRALYIRIILSLVLSVLSIWLFCQIFNIDLLMESVLLTISIVTSVVVIVILLFKGSVKQILPLILNLYLLGVSCGVGFFFNEILEPHQRNRMEVLLGLKYDPYNDGYHVNQSMIAIGSGGFSGKGFLQGTQTKFNFVPEQATDFIFCTVGEEWGFLGTTAVILIFVLFLLRLIFLAERQESIFSRVYGYAVVMVFFSHFAINIAMTIGYAPVIGIPLPFFSYGGSSLISFTLLLFIFLRLDVNRNDPLI